MLEKAAEAGSAAEISATMNALKKERQANMAADRKKAVSKRRALAAKQEATAKPPRKKHKSTPSDTY